MTRLGISTPDPLQAAALVQQLADFGAVLGIVIGLVGAYVGVATLRANRDMARANADMAESTRRSVSIAKRSLAQAAVAIQDQIETNRASRAASVQITSARHSPLEMDGQTLDDSPYAHFPGTRAVVEFTVMNRGTAPAFGVIARAIECNGLPIPEGVIVDDPQSFFTAFPIDGWDIILPASFERGKFTVRRLDTEGEARGRLDLTIRVLFSDTLGSHFANYSVTFFSTSSRWDSTAFVRMVVPSQIDESALTCPPTLE